MVPDPFSSSTEPRGMTLSDRGILVAGVALVMTFWSRASSSVGRGHVRGADDYAMRVFSFLA